MPYLITLQHLPYLFTTVSRPVLAANYSTCITMTRKFILKPGKHSFAPGEAAVHDNKSLTDDEARWYLEEYPHIRPLFQYIPDEEDGDIAELDDFDLLEDFS